ncbi:hypothetical protein BpHYR1_017026 [Brachionus plicatilis]|uniref:Uncharacterized protein n=1 Tax=Brachionus plicatilis TaxID=10195 RepID=A0A3M7RPR7_BRAPC|nr:hypothetical protein BpHYR1_017026 [Brachionus plicatilis]
MNNYFNRPQPIKDQSRRTKLNRHRVLTCRTGIVVRPDQVFQEEGCSDGEVLQAQRGPTKLEAIPEEESSPQREDLSIEGEAESSLCGEDSSSGIASSFVGPLCACKTSPSLQPSS